MHWTTEIHNALGFSETKGTMRRVSRYVLKRRIGGQLSAPLSCRPRLDRANQSTRHTVTSRSGLDIQPLEKRDRRTVRTVHVVEALRRFNEAYRGTICGDSEANEVATGDSIGHSRQVLSLGARPQPYA
jgi:hypothetical protein